MKPLPEVTTEEEARDIAIFWQHWASEQNQIGEKPTLYMSDLAEWNDYFEALAEKFPDLKEEFEENGII